MEDRHSDGASEKEHDDTAGSVVNMRDDGPARSAVDGLFVWALYDYTPTTGEDSSADDGKLPLRRGERIQVLQQLASGWWDGISGARRGWFPSNFVSTPPQLESIAPEEQFGWELVEEENISNGQARFYMNRLTGETATIQVPTVVPDEKTAVDLAAASQTTEQPLPPHWATKRTAEGRLYYYNIMTNQTTWNRDLIGASDVHARARHPQQQAKSEPEWQANASSNWETFRQTTTLLLGRLKDAAHTDIKGQILTHTAHIVQSVHQALLATDMVDRDTPMLRANKQLRVHHRHLMKSISRLVLTAKQASSVWPPPDSSVRLIDDADQVLLVVRHFTAAAQTAKIALNEAIFPPPAAADVGHYDDDDENNDDGATHGNEKRDNLQQEQQHLHRHDAGTVMELRAEDLLNAMDETVQALFNGVVEFRAHLGNDQITHQECLPDTIIMTRRVVTLVGQLLSLVDDIPANNLPETERTTADMEAFLSHKQALYEDISSLVSATTTAADPLAPVDSRQQLAAALNAMEQSAVQLIYSAKHLIEYLHSVEQASLAGRLGRLSVVEEHEVSAQSSVPKSGTYSPTGSPVKNSGRLRQRRALSMTHSEAISIRDRTTPPPSPEKTTTTVTTTTTTEKKRGTRANKSAALVINTANIANQPRANPPHHATTAPSSAASAQSELTITGHDNDGSQHQPGSMSPVIASRVGESRQNVSVSAPAQTRRTLTGRSSLNTPDSSKLSKFFGEDMHQQLDHYHANTQSQHHRQWFLGSDSGPRDLILSMEGTVKGGTMKALIERLTSHQLIDVPYVNAFLLTYRSFTTASEFLDRLIARFVELQPPQPTTDGDSPLTQEELDEWREKKQKVIRLRVVGVIRTWLQQFFFSRDEMSCLNRIVEFADVTVRDVIPAAADSLCSNVEMRRDAGAITYTSMAIPAPQDDPNHLSGGGRQLITSPGVKDSAPPAPIVPRNLQAKKFRLTDIEAQEIARQLTVLESRLFSNIQALEFLDKAWSDKSAGADSTVKAPNIKAMIRSTNQITGWVARTILVQQDIKKRAGVMKYFIHLAERCRALNNFNTLMAILAALSSSPVHRLKRTRELLSTKSRATLEELKLTMAPGQNFANYRNLLKSLSPPCVPFLGRYLTDLTFIEDGNPNMVKSQPHLLNFDKRYKTAEKVREIQQYQRHPYSLVEVRELQEFLMEELLVGQDCDAEELYQQSLVIEPREREDEKIARLLHESGFL